MKIYSVPILLLLAFFAGGSFSLAQIKKPETKKPKPLSFKSARQMILVTTPDWNSVQGTLQRYERKKTSGAWRKAGDEIQIVVGRKGLAWGEGIHEKEVFQTEQPLKKEGDGKSPAGIFPLESVFGTTPRAEAAWLKMPYLQLEESTECVDDVNSGKYNQIVDRYKVGVFDWKSSEKMLEVGEQYSWGVTVAHNSNPPERGKGSCIFLHIWKAPDSGTSGCTAMERSELETVLRWLDKKQNPVLVQLPATEIDRLGKTWKLPKQNN